MDDKRKYEFLEKELRLFIEYNSYMVLHFSILYWHLDDVTPLQNVLLSNTIKEDSKIEIAYSGEKMFFELYKYLRLVKSSKINDWLKAKFPKMETQFISSKPYFSFACIDSFNQKVFEEKILEYCDLEEMINQ